MLVSTTNTNDHNTEGSSFVWIVLLDNWTFTVEFIASLPVKLLPVPCIIGPTGLKPWPTHTHTLAHFAKPGHSQNSRVLFWLPPSQLPTHTHTPRNYIKKSTNKPTMWHSGHWIEVEFMSFPVSLHVLLSAVALYTLKTKCEMMEVEITWSACIEAVLSSNLRKQEITQNSCATKIVLQSKKNFFLFVFFLKFFAG